MMEMIADGLLAAGGSSYVDASSLPLLLPLLLGAGLLVGLYHALEPDHITAMAALVGRGGGSAGPGRLRRAGVGGSVHGLLWGLGHTSTVFLVAAAVFVFSFSIPERLFGAFEVAVGIMLLALGASAISGGRIPVLSRLHLHSHVHRHEDGTVHSHPHSHGGRKNGGGNVGTHHTHGHKPYLIGCIHGLAGSGALTILLLAAFMPDGAAHAAPHPPLLLPLLPPLLLFISMFGAGSMIGMAAMTGALSLLFVACGSAAWRYIRYASGTAAMALGAYIITTGVWAPL